MSYMKNKSSQNRKDTDPSFYDGPSKSTVYNSFVKLFADLIHDLKEILDVKDFSLITLWISKFLEAFWKQSRSCQNGQEVSQLADLCKARRNDLHNVVNDLISGKAPAFPGDYYLIARNAEKGSPPLRLTEATFFPNSFKGVINFMEEFQHVMSYVELKESPGFYVYLHKIVFKLVSSFTCSEEEYEKHKEKIVQLLLLPVSLGQVFEHMNPSPDKMEEFGQNLLKLIRTESQDPSEDFKELFNAVAQDICKKYHPSREYVKHFSKARRKFNRLWKKHQLDFKDSDFYLTAKASTVAIRAYGKTKRYPAIYASMFEIDPIVDHPLVRPFDDAIHYHSAYIKEHDIPSHIQVQQWLVVTQMIFNPSKYKPRGIHVGCNAIQDRCKYLHRLFIKTCDEFESCCTKEHFKGVMFLKKVTSPEYRLEHFNNVFVSDFSNATDTLNQWFQVEVIRLIYNDIIANFWMFISKLPKTMRHPSDGHLEDYIQMTGQPQGLLGSFDAFTLAHMFLVCMLMKHFHLESMSLDDMLVVVGDDSVISYPKDLEDKDKVEGDTFYDFHSWLCKEVSLIKNDSKSAKSFFDKHGNYTHEILDFAKISIRDGIFMTPIPYGLASAYASIPGKTDIQLFTWLASKGVVYKELTYRKTFEAYYKYQDQLMAAMSVLSSGQIPYLKSFEDKTIYDSIDSTISGVSMYMFLINQIEHTFLSDIFSETNKEDLKTEDFVSKCLKTIEDEFLDVEHLLKEMIQYIPRDHKYNIMVEKNMQLALDLQDVLDYKGDRESLSLMLGCLISEKYAPLFRNWIKYNDKLVACLENDDPDLWMFFSKQEYYDHFKRVIDPLKSYQIKSMKKASFNNSLLLKTSARKTAQTISKSELLTQLTRESRPMFIDRLIDLIGDDY